MSTAHGGYVLAVDDDEAVRVVMAEALRRAGYEVRVAADGLEAFGMMERGPLPALLLLDLAMPRMSGWDVLRAMNGHPRLASIPVVVLTGFTERRDVPSGHAVLHKPIDPELLVSLVDEIRAQEESILHDLEEPPSDLLPKPSRPPRALR